jgi:hypothetical protein
MRASGISSTDAEHEAALKRTREFDDAISAEGIVPVLIGDSGNGGHCLLAIDLPNNNESNRLIKRVFNAIAAKFSDPPGTKNGVKFDVPNSNASRVWKIYGTIAAKGSHTAERPHRTARILALRTEDGTDFKQLIATKAELETLADKWAPPKKPPASASSTEGSTNSRVQLTHEQIAEALKHVGPVDDRDVWLKVGMALKAELGEAGRPLWDDWSRTSTKFDEPEQDKTWETINGDGDITIGTVLKAAKEGGWETRAYNGPLYNGLFHTNRTAASVPQKVPKPLPIPQKPSAWFREEEERFANTTFIWDGILEAGGISIVTGRKGNGKSTFTRSLAMAIGQGLPILGRGTTQSQVWYLNLEPGGKGRIDVWRNLGLSDESGVDLQTIPPVAGHEGVFEWLRQNISEKGYKVVVVDTMFKLLKIEGANDYDTGLYAQVPIEEICRDTGVHFILVHHSRKNRMSEAESVAEQILGATSLAGAACACMLVNRRQSKYTFRMDPPRYGTAIENETVIGLDDKGAITVEGSWRGTWANLSKAAVWQFALKQIEWFTAREADITNDTTGERMRIRDVQWSLNALFDEGKLDRRKREIKTRGTPPFEYKVKAD